VPESSSADDAVRAIEALVFRYAERLDEGDFAGVGELFAYGRITTEDATVVAEGSEAVERLYRHTVRLHDDGTPRTRHVTTNIIVELDPSGATAEARSYFTVLQQTADVALQPIVAGRYRDRFELVTDGNGGGDHDGQWRFTERQMFPLFVGDVHDHLLIDL
jgi:3-phenylpropionate/cinnamic acid dioxygenase small subunit